MTLFFFTEKDAPLRKMSLTAQDVTPEYSPSSVLLSSPRCGEDRALQSRKLLLVVVDFDDFMCMTCLDSFLDFCRSFPQSVLEKFAWGILILKPGSEGEGENRHAAIAEKKLRGIMRANQITFPFSIDETGSFESFACSGSSVVLFDEENGKVFRYGFPLDKEDVLQIRESLLGN